MHKKVLILGALLALVCMAVGSAYADHVNKVWYYTSSTGPYADECAYPYVYSNYGYHPYPYINAWFPNGVHPTGPFLYGPNGHVHRDLCEAVTPPPPPKEEAAPPPPPAEAPAPPPPPAAKPEGD
jgi:hypothetical protein